MSNFTQITLSNLCLVTDSDLTSQQETHTMSTDEQNDLQQTKAMLDSIRFSPRPATLQLIIDYAAGKQPKR